MVVVNDGNPISRLDICRAAMKNPKFSGAKLPTFEGQDKDGKKCSIEKLNKWWTEGPKFQSFVKFMEDNYGEEMKIDLL